MTRWAILMSAMLMVGGCSQDETPQAAAKPNPTPVAAAPVAPAPAAAAPAKSASKGYYEMNKGGKTYVFGNVPTMQMVARGDTVAGLVTKEAFGPAGETVVFESDGAGMETRLAEEYGKQHPKK